MFATTTSLATLKVGSHRGAPRIWIDGRLPSTAGFLPGLRYTASLVPEKLRLILKISESGERVVSSKTRRGTDIPVLDLNSSKLLALLGFFSRVRVWAIKDQICIEPVASDMRLKERVDRLRHKISNGLPLAVASFAHGGGVLSKAIHDGFSDAGIHTELAFANEIEANMIEHAAEVNPIWSSKTIMIAAPMQEVVADHAFMRSLPQADVMELGLPCLGASLSGRAKNRTTCAEEHSSAGHLLVSFLNAVNWINPSFVVLENVVPYEASASMFIIKSQLQDMGYDIHMTHLHGMDWNTLEDRKRMCMIAVSKGIEFSIDQIERPERIERVLGEIMEDVALDDHRWSKFSYLFSKEERDKAAGKGFRMQIVSEASAKIGVVGRSYAKVRSTEPLIQHPTDPTLFRLLTPGEHCAAMGIDEQLISGLPKTTAHELCGQSVNPGPFRSVGKALATAALRLANGVIDTVMAVCDSISTLATSGAQTQQARAVATICPLPANAPVATARPLQGDLF